MEKFVDHLLSTIFFIIKYTILKTIFLIKGLNLIESNTASIVVLFFVIYIVYRFFNDVISFVFKVVNFLFKITVIIALGTFIFKMNKNEFDKMFNHGAIYKSQRTIKKIYFLINDLFGIKYSKLNPYNDFFQKFYKTLNYDFNNFFTFLHEPRMNDYSWRI